MNTCKKFIVIDGPNGVGKTTVINSLKKRLLQKNLDFIVTKEPTDSTIGNFIRENQNSYYANTLAALVAADRYDHIEKLIQPNLDKGKIVISDRYLASSLVYQVLDGLDYEFVLQLNAKIILPSLYFILTAISNTISERLSNRNSLTRFELDKKSNESKLFEEAGNFLKGKGDLVKFIKNDDRSSDETVKEISSIIHSHLSSSDTN
jgi:dTMP kinase